MQINSISGYNQQNSRNRCSTQPNFRGERECEAALEIIGDALRLKTYSPKEAGGKSHLNANQVGEKITEIGTSVISAIQKSFDKLSPNSTNVTKTVGKYGNEFFNFKKAGSYPSLGQVVVVKQTAQTPKGMVMYLDYETGRNVGITTMNNEIKIINE